jgi:uncharacterized membrane protein YjfL (UPF0719 family)
MDLFSAIALPEVVSTIVYTLLGVVLMWGCWKVIDLLTPFSIVKEIEDGHNMALAVLIGALFIALSIIIAAVILS